MGVTAFALGPLRCGTAIDTMCLFPTVFISTDRKTLSWLSTT